MQRFPSAAVVALLVCFAANASPRIRYTINDSWRYSDGHIEGAEARDFTDSSWQRVHLPHTWNALDAADKTKPYRRGAGWYRRTLPLDRAWRGKRVFLFFEGANQVADVWVNGRQAGRHIGGYTAFVFDITDLVTFERDVVAVRVDNSHNADIPPLNADFTFFGGIYRDVWMIATDPVHIDVTDHASPGVFISTPTLSEKSGVVRAQGSVRNDTATTARVRVVHRVLDATRNEVASVTSALQVKPRDVARFDRTTARIPSPNLWSPDRPYLYRVRSEVYRDEKLVDVVENTFGFRWFTADPNTGLTLNGKPLPLRGTNRHQDHPRVGTAVSDESHRRDVQIIKDNGFNFLRLAHYPQDPAVLDEADRLGLIVWEEIPVVNLISISTAFADNSDRMLVEMIRQHFNHPSIFFWGYMNEVLLIKPEPVPAGYYEVVPELTRRLEATARREDPTRLTVMALSRDEIHDDRGIGAVPHILGLNLYFGWYYETLETLGPFLDRIHAERPRHPIIVSEYGADGDERVHSTGPRAFDYSSEYAQSFHVASFPQLESRPFVLGTAVWNQFDFSSGVRQNTKFAMNLKGLYFHDRTPKDVAYYYRAALTTEPIVYVAREWSERAGVDRLQPVWVYSNQPAVELFVNGESAGSRPVENRTARWSVALRPGENRLRAQSGSISDEATIRFSDRNAKGFVAVNAGGHYSYFDGATTWEEDRGFTGGKPQRTYHRIFATNDDALFQATREGVTAYHFDVPDGTYELRLGFAETKAGAKAGDRVFSVRVNGRDFVRDLDLVAEAGGYAAVTRAIGTEATGGSGIRIAFEASKGETTISSILIRP